MILFFFCAYYDVHQAVGNCKAIFDTRSSVQNK